jgi:hypothetical protein
MHKKNYTLHTYWSQNVQCRKELQILVLKNWWSLLGHQSRPTRFKKCTTNCCQFSWPAHNILEPVLGRPSKRNQRQHWFQKFDRTIRTKTTCVTKVEETCMWQWRREHNYSEGRPSTGSRMLCWPKPSQRFRFWCKLTPCQTLKFCMSMYNICSFVKNLSYGIIKTQVSTLEEG